MVVYNWQNFGFGTLAIIIGLYLSWSSYMAHKETIASKNWPVTIGEVIAGEIIKHSGRNGGTSYLPEITYSYSLLGKEQTRKVKYQPKYTKDTAEVVLNKLPIGTHIKIFYNPANPENCLSEYDEEKSPLNGLIALVIGIVIILLAFVPWGGCGNGAK